MNASNKVIYNTGILYFKMIVTAGISLYATRLILGELGVVDYGIYNLISGVIIMFYFLNIAMTNSTQRYFSFYQGKKDMSMQKKVFAGSMLLHALLGILMVIILEVAGIFLLNGFLNIPADRLPTAKIIYHFLTGSIFFTILSVPYMAALTARENMTWIAIVSTSETLMKVGSAFCLLIVTGDKLIYFGFLSAMISVVSFILYAIYCTRNYEECKDIKGGKIDKALMKEMTTFAGWNVFGALSGSARMQGLAIILNLFFGAAINAAYGIANQISIQLNFFSATLLRVLNPQIMISEGANDRKRMLRLSMMASKFAFFLLAILAIPCIFEMPALLSFWLKEVPEYTIIFCSLMLITILTNLLTVGLQSSFQATGQIKMYQILVSFVLLLNLPLAYFLLKAGYPPYIVFVSYIAVEFSACIVRIVLAKIIVGLSIREYIANVFMKESIPVAVITGVSYLSTYVWHMEYRFLLTLPLAMLAFVVSIYFWGLCDDEKQLINKLIKRVKKNFHPIALLSKKGELSKEL